MSNLTDRVSYIRGLAEGLKLSTETDEGKIIEKMLELLSEMADDMEEMKTSLSELDEYVDSIDSDLSDLEDAVYDDEEGCCGGCEGCQSADGDEDAGDEDENDEEGENVVEYTCPHCGEEMTFDVENFDFDEDYLCPSCHKPLFPETPDEE